MSSLDQETVDLEASSVAQQDPQVLGLTILLHPDLNRVGEVAPLFTMMAGGRATVSRLSPEFTVPIGGERRPLETPLVSRQAIVIRTDESGACVVEGPELARWSIAGQVLTSFVLDAGSLDRGVELELAGSVVLLLHTLSLQAEPAGQLGLLGNSASVRRLRAAILQVADGAAPVLIRGESGSGKELVARALHANSSRRAGPFVAVNAAAIPREMAASALFGHARGAFTGAASTSRGYFGQADGGSLFLDEIGELSRDLQGLLLRATREGEIQPLGETRPRKVDVRLITATDADLQALVAAGQFSMPLLRRIEAFTLDLPALRARPDDIPRLFMHFLTQELTAVGEAEKLTLASAKEKAWLPRKLIRALLRYDWPGNVAELQTVARHVAISNRGHRRFEWSSWLTERLSPNDLTGQSGPPAPGSIPEAGAQRPSPRIASTWPPDAAGKERNARVPPTVEARALTDAQVVEAMVSSRFRVARAAERLGVSRSWLHTRLEHCDGLRPAKELTAEEILNAAGATGNAPRQMAERLRVSEHALKLRAAALNLSLGPRQPRNA